MSDFKLYVMKREEIREGAIINIDKVCTNYSKFIKFFQVLLFCFTIFK